MGREVRRTPVGWVPPKRTVRQFVGEIDMSKGLAGAFFDRPMADVEVFQPQCDRTLAQAVEEWEAEKADWISRREETIKKHGIAFYDSGLIDDYADSQRPDRYTTDDGQSYADYYRPDWSEDEMVGYQLYESVTEGTPLTPSFATKEELIDHLARWGQAWGEEDFVRAMTREDAEGLVNMGSFPSFMIVSTEDAAMMVNSENMVSSGLVDTEGRSIPRDERPD